MKLWILSPFEGLPESSNPWVPWYDKCFGLVIRAETEEEARNIANDKQGYDLNGAWLDTKLSKCEELLEDGDEGIIICDVHWA